MKLFKLTAIGTLIFLGIITSAQADESVSDSDRAMFLTLQAITQNLADVTEPKFSSYTKEKDVQARWIALHFDAIAILVEATQRYLWIMKKSELANAVENYRKQLIRALNGAPHKGSLIYLETHFVNSLQRAMDSLLVVQPLLSAGRVQDPDRFHRLLVLDLRVLLQTLNFSHHELTLTNEVGILKTPILDFTFKSDATIEEVATSEAAQIKGVRLRLNHIQKLFTKLTAIVNLGEPKNADPALIALFKAVAELKNIDSDGQTLAQLTALEQKIRVAIRLFTYDCPRLFVPAKLEAN